MAPNREEDNQGDVVPTLWIAATAPYQKLSGSMKEEDGVANIIGLNRSHGL